MEQFISQIQSAADPYDLALIEAVRKNFEIMCEDPRFLFVTDVSIEELWNTYLSSIPAKINPIFRKRQTYDCSTCRDFFRRAGAIVSVRDGQMRSVWDVDLAEGPFVQVAKKLSSVVKSHPIQDVFRTPFSQAGVQKNYGLMEDGTSLEFHHFFLGFPEAVVTDRRETPAEIQASFRDSKNVFLRSLQEISMDAIDMVLELTAQGSLYRGEEWRGPVFKLKEYKAAFDALTDERARELFAWEKSIEAGPAIARIRNHSMGTLLTDLTEGKDLEEAVRGWEKIMAPTNYKRPKPIFTEKMLEDAKAVVQELGFAASLPRRYASLNDLNIQDVLFVNRDQRRPIAGAASGLDFFEDMKKDAVRSPRQFERVETVSIQDFLERILPSASNLEVFFESRHMSHLVSLIAPVNPGSPSMFPWENGFSWAYRGNIADSQIKEQVKAHGGKVDGVLRFSIQWNDLPGLPSENDEDAHCIEPNGFEIYYGKKLDKDTLGQLDVDIIHPGGKVAVENITWPELSRMKPGIYQFFVYTFTSRGGRGGFRAEIEAGGEVHSYDYSYDTKHNQKIPVANVTLDKQGNFTIRDLLDSSVSSREEWGLSTNQFVPVSLVCYSPNYWEGTQKTGNRHVFFMIPGCENKEAPNGFFNEQLRPELIPHRKVFEALGSRAKVADAPDQLSGLGFSATIHTDLIVRVTGATQRVLRVRF